MADFYLTPHENPSAPTIFCKSVAKKGHTVFFACAAAEKPGQPAFKDVTATYCRSDSDKPGTDGLQQCEMMKVDCDKGKCVVTAFDNDNAKNVMLVFSEPTLLGKGQPLYVVNQSLLQH